MPEGTFQMGNEDLDALLAVCSRCDREDYTNEQPQHQVNVDAFWIDQTEVTNAQYAAIASTMAIRSSI